MTTVFCDTSVLIRYFTEDDIPRALAAATLIDSDTDLVVSTGVILEVVHVLRTAYRVDDPLIGGLLIRFLSRSNVQLSDADKSGVLSALAWTQGSSARRIADAMVATSAERAQVDFIATFDARMTSPTIPVRLL